MRPDRVNPETPVEIIAMIKVSGSPWLQEQLRSYCRELINIFSTSVRSLPAQVDPMVIETSYIRYRPNDTVHNSMVGHWGLQKFREFPNDPMITDRTIT